MANLTALLRAKRGPQRLWRRGGTVSLKLNTLADFSNESSSSLALAGLGGQFAIAIHHLLGPLLGPPSPALVNGI
jgi:hypothetical protein